MAAPRPRIVLAWPKPDYASALAAAGADVRVLDPRADALPAALDEADGVLLTGGVDVDPARYGAADRHPTVEVDPARDEYELALARLALDRRMPLLAICRGLQVLNVSAGGSLVQDLPSARPSDVPHDVREPKTALAHDVAVARGSTLGRLLGTRLDADGRVAVNSRHHQAVDRLAPGFTVTATAPDGTVEAIEPARDGFCVAVQWHPENFWRTGEFSALFEGLVSAARSRAGASTHAR